MSRRGYLPEPDWWYVAFCAALVVVLAVGLRYCWASMERECVAKGGRVIHNGDRAPGCLMPERTR